MKINLPASVASSQDVTALQLELRDYARWAAHEAVKRSAGSTKKSAAPVLSAACHELLALQGNKKELGPDQLAELAKELERYARQAPTITFTLAAPAPAPVKASLVAWARQHIRPDLLVNFQFNATILGGLVVRYGSHVYDWSFKRQLLAGRAAFSEVLRRV